MLRRLMAGLVIALVIVLLVVQPLLASSVPVVPAKEEHYGLSCVDGVCRAQLDLAVATAWLPQGAWLTVLQSALRQLPGEAGVALRDDVTIALPMGNLSLVDADLVLTFDTMGKIATLRGSAAAPVPTFGLLGDWQLVTPTRVAVGYDRGDALVELNAPLQAERRYFFLTAEAGLHLLTQGMALTSDAGQRATLIVDFAQPLVYVDGQVTLYTDGQMAFLREALGPLGEGDWFPTDLPLRQSIMVHLQGQIGGNVEPKLTLEGEYRVDGGMVGRWLQIDATPLLARGQAIIRPQGLFLAGSARSALQPDRWFNSGAQAQIYVPFDAPDTASLMIEADVTSTAMDFDGNVATTMAGEVGWMGRTGQDAWREVQFGWNQMGVAAQDGYGWMRDGIGTGWAFTRETWCGWTSACPQNDALAAVAE